MHAMGTRRAQLAIMGAAESWLLVAAGRSLGSSYAVPAQSIWDAEPTRDIAVHVAVASGSAALLLRSPFPWVSAPS